LDHLRAITFAVTDGAFPSNEGRGYVIRKLIRKSVLHLRALGVEEPLLYQFVPAVGLVMGDAYPEIRNDAKSVASVVKAEEEQLWSIIETKVPQAEIKIKSIALTMRPGQEDFASRTATELAFEFYDTHGVPKEIMELIVQENRLRFDNKHFESLMEKQKERSRGSSKISGNIFAVDESKITDHSINNSVFTGYDKTEDEGKVLRLYAEGAVTSKLEKGQQGYVIADRTPFYAEQGGQVGDEGMVSTKSGKARVLDTQWHDKLVIHQVMVEEGDIKLGDALSLRVDANRRLRIMKNHTATHLLHSALRKVLGEHVKQRGSLVAPDRLRFDFSHAQSLTPKEIQAVETLVNSEIAKKRALTTEIKETQAAMAEGAMAFFGEKYDADVRVVTAGDFSKELCGGTHCRNTEQIGLFKIISEGSIQSGVRRIEAVTGDDAYRAQAEMEAESQNALAYIGADPSSADTVLDKAKSRLAVIQKRYKSIFQKIFRSEMERTIADAADCSGTRLVIAKFDGVDKDILRESADWIRNKNGSHAVVLCTILQEKPQVVVAFSKDLVERKLSANQLVKDLAQLIGGNGGGRPDMATGGGQSQTDVNAMLDYARQRLGEMIKQS
jgi:alanyl-tRNA synthetase